MSRRVSPSGNTVVLFDYDTALDPSTIDMVEPGAPTPVVSPEWEEGSEWLSQDCFSQWEESETDPPWPLYEPETLVHVMKDPDTMEQR